MRILYIANARIPTEKAHGLQIAKMAEAFTLSGHQIKLLIPNRKNHIKENIFDYYNLKTKFKIKYLPNYFSFLENINKKLYFKLQRILFYKHAFIIGLFSKEKIIYSREILICFLLTLFGKISVLEDHEPKKSKKFLYKLFLKTIKKKIIVPYNLKKLYQEYGINRNSYIVAPNAVDLNEFKKVSIDKNIWQREFNINKKVILYVGHFYKWKGVYTLLDASYKIDNPVILIGGTKEDQIKIRKYIKNNKIINVYIRSFIPHSKIIKYIKSADVLVLPNTSKEERSAKYTTPIKLFEYMASGVPIVASQLDSFKYFLKDHLSAILFKPDNINDLADKIKYILNNPKFARDISFQAQENVKQYSWAKRAKNIINFIQN